MILAASTKAMLLRQSLKTINKLTERLGTCNLEDFHRVQNALFDEKVAYKILEAAQVKPKRGRK